MFVGRAAEGNIIMIAIIIIVIIKIIMIIIIIVIMIIKIIKIGHFQPCDSLLCQSFWILGKGAQFRS